MIGQNTSWGFVEKIYLCCSCCLSTYYLKRKAKRVQAGKKAAPFHMERKQPTRLQRVNRGKFFNSFKTGWNYSTFFRKNLSVSAQLEKVPQAESRFSFSFRRWMSVVWRRPSPLTSTGARFARDVTSVLGNSLNRLSISSLVLLGFLCFPGASRM